MSRKLLDAFSMEEAFRALNNEISSKNRLKEYYEDVAAQEIVEIPKSDWAVQANITEMSIMNLVSNYSFAKTSPRGTSMNPNLDKCVHQYYVDEWQKLIDSGIKYSDLYKLTNVVKVFTTKSEAERTKRPETGNRVAHLLQVGLQLGNGDYLYFKQNAGGNRNGVALVKCKSYESMCNYIRNRYNSKNDLIE